VLAGTGKLESLPYARLRIAAGGGLAIRIGGLKLERAEADNEQLRTRGQGEFRKKDANRPSRSTVRPVL
jgi:hypothetical protein